MKKIYTLIAGLVIAGTVNAQVTKELTSHISPAFAGYTGQAPHPGIGALTLTGNGGYLSGTNADGDVAVIQLFDEAAGVTGTGTINTVSFFANNFRATTGTAKYKLAIYENNNGNPGNVIAEQEFALNTIDTAAASLQAYMGGTSILGMYNVSKSFTGVNIPANKSFFVGVVLPTTAAAGDTLAVGTTIPAANFQNPSSVINYEYPKASTHAGVIGSNGTFYTYGADYQLKSANLIYANVTVSTVVSVDELATKNALKVFPNPANDVLNFSVTDAEITAVNIFSTDGKLVISSDFSNVQNGQIVVSDLNTGIYLYEVVAANGATSKAKFIKK